MLISGGGIAGLTLAYWLRRYGMEPVVIEQAVTLRSDGYAIDFFGTGYDVAEHMNLIRLLGYRTDGSEEDLRALARLGIVVAFEPASSMQSEK